MRTRKKIYKNPGVAREDTLAKVLHSTEDVSPRWSVVYSYLQLGNYLMIVCAEGTKQFLLP